LSKSGRLRPSSKFRELSRHSPARCRSDTIAMLPWKSSTNSKSCKFAGKPSRPPRVPEPTETSLADSFALVNSPFCFALVDKLRAFELRAELLSFKERRPNRSRFQRLTRNETDCQAFVSLVWGNVRSRLPSKQSAQGGRVRISRSGSDSFSV
jgi:hypothetical protein